MKTKKASRPASEVLWASRSEEILESAAQLFAKHGYADTDTQMLADLIGVGKGTLYRYFPSKEKLFLATVDRAIRSMREYIDSRIQGIEDAFERISIAVKAYLEFFDQNPGCVELLIQERAQFKDRKKPTYFVHREAHLDRWKDMYRSLIRAKKIRNIPVERITDVFTQLMYGTIFVNYFTGVQRSPEAQAQDILDIVFHGIKMESDPKSVSKAKKLNGNAGRLTRSE